MVSFRSWGAADFVPEQVGVRLLGKRGLVCSLGCHARRAMLVARAAGEDIFVLEASASVHFAQNRESPRDREG